MSTSGNSHDACTKALDAGSKQTGIEQDVNKVEDTVSKKADKKARELVGDTGMTVGAVVGGAGKAVADKAIVLRFPVFLPSMFISTQVGVQKSLLGLEWKY
jgi:hypothetical protein